MRAVLIGVYAVGVALAPSPWISLALASPLVLVPLVWWLLNGPNRWIAGFLGAALLLPPLPIAIGNSGPHPALMFAGAGAGIGIIRLREWSLRIDALGRAMLVFFAILLGSVACAALYSGLDVAAGSLARVVLFGISLYVYFFTAQGPGSLADLDPRRAIRWLLAAATVAAAFACFDFYYQLPAPAGYGEQFVWLDSGVFRRAQGLFYEASTLGNFCAFFLVLIAVLASEPRESRLLPRFVLAIAGAVLAAALIFSYSRGSVAALAASLAALLYLRRGRYQLRRWLFMLPVSLAVGAAAVYFLFPAFGEVYLRRLSRSLEFFFSDPDSILSGRVETWRSAFTLILEHPWYLLTGVGYKTLPYSDFGGRPIVVDNMYFSLLIETGIAGVAAFLWMNYRILLTAYRCAHSLFGAWIFCFWVGEMLQMLSGDLFTYWRVLPVYFWVLAAASHERSLR